MLQHGAYLKIPVISNIMHKRLAAENKAAGYFENPEASFPDGV